MIKFLSDISLFWCEKKTIFLIRFLYYKKYKYDKTFSFNKSIDFSLFSHNKHFNYCSQLHYYQAS